MKQNEVVANRKLIRPNLAELKDSVTTVNRTKRRFKLNLQKVRIRDENGRVRTVKVCAKYIKSGLVEKV